MMVFLLLQDATGNAADIAVGWAIGCGAPFAFGEPHSSAASEYAQSSLRPCLTRDK